MIIHPSPSFRTGRRRAMALAAVAALGACAEAPSAPEVSALTSVQSTAPVAGWSSQTGYRHAETPLQRAIVASALAQNGASSGRSLMVSAAGGATPWLTDASGADGAAMRAAIQRYHAWKGAGAGRPALATVRETMAADFARTAYDAQRRRMLVDRIISVYDAQRAPVRVPATDQETLDFLGVRKQCLEWAVTTAVAAGGEARGYSAAAVANPSLHRPGMGLYRHDRSHSMIIVDIYWDAKGQPVKYRVAESNWGSGWQNPGGMLPWQRTVRTGREVAAGDKVVDFARAGAQPPVAVPAITSATPNPFIGSAEDRPLLLDVRNVRQGATVIARVNGATHRLSGAQVALVSPTQLRVLIRTGTTPAEWWLQVDNGGGSVSAPFRLQVVAPPAPRATLHRVSPNPVPAVPGEQVISVFGQGIRPGATLVFRVNGSTYPVGPPFITYVSASELRVRVRLGTTPAYWTVQAVNPGAAESPAVGFHVAAPAAPRPVLHQVNPNPVPAIPREQVLTLWGRDLRPGATLLFRVNGNAYTVGSQFITYLGSSQLRVRVTLGTTPAYWTVQAVNPGGAVSDPVGFAVR